eukprot:gb/GEZN01006339.1/.p1 GENE.gb/GEZN01006339.1/~~gb/GEZN01006339.1/.p1  ORF type:complete len:528 (+),score=43.01 gb/GEZN01006339.1/:116-1585(+)
MVRQTRPRNNATVTLGTGKFSAKRSNKLVEAWLEVFVTSDAERAVWMEAIIRQVRATTFSELVSQPAQVARTVSVFPQKAPQRLGGGATAGSAAFRKERRTSEQDTSVEQQVQAKMRSLPGVNRSLVSPSPSAVRRSPSTNTRMKRAFSVIDIGGRRSPRKSSVQYQSKKSMWSSPSQPFIASSTASAASSPQGRQSVHGIFFSAFFQSSGPSGKLTRDGSESNSERTSPVVSRPASPQSGSANDGRPQSRSYDWGSSGTVQVMRKTDQSSSFSSSYLSKRAAAHSFNRRGGSLGDEDDQSTMSVAVPWPSSLMKRNGSFSGLGSLDSSPVQRKSNSEPTSRRGSLGPAVIPVDTRVEFDEELKVSNAKRHHRRTSSSGSTSSDGNARRLDGTTARAALEVSVDSARRRSSTGDIKGVNRLGNIPEQTRLTQQLPQGKYVPNSSLGTPPKAAMVNQHLPSPLPSSPAKRTILPFRMGNTDPFSPHFIRS